MKKIVTLNVLLLFSSVCVASKSKLEYQLETTFLDTMISPKSLVFGGAGILGVMYTEAVEKLDIDLSKVENFVGASSGAINAAILSNNIPIDSVKARLRYFNLGLCRKATNLNFRDGGLYSNKNISLLLEYIGEISSSMTMAQHHLKNHNDLYIAATVRDLEKIETDKMIYFSHQRTPLVNIVDAVRASSSIAFYFEPLYCTDSSCTQITDKRTRYQLLDANVSNNLPIEIVKEKNGNYEDMLVMYVKTIPDIKKIKTPAGYLGEYMSLKTDKSCLDKIKHLGLESQMLVIPSGGYTSTIHNISTRKYDLYSKQVTKGIANFQFKNSKVSSR